MNESTLYIASQILLPQSLHLKTTCKGLSALSVWCWWQNCKYTKGCDNSSGGEVMWSAMTRSVCKLIKIKRQESQEKESIQTLLLPCWTTKFWPSFKLFKALSSPFFFILSLAYYRKVHSVSRLMVATFVRDVEKVGTVLKGGWTELKVFLWSFEIQQKEKKNQEKIAECYPPAPLLSQKRFKTPLFKLHCF